ncbi:hypothetical protein H9P43_003359 [Blastocladiella emersonii ATCC 22665]|nr:hypothetical protein H9P43_003359 [Blastocladiella emersonii ATCC 22665]
MTINLSESHFVCHPVNGSDSRPEPGPLPRLAASASLGPSPVTARISFTTDLRWALYYERNQTINFRDPARKVMVFDIPSHRLSRYSGSSLKARNYSNTASEHTAAREIELASDFWELNLPWNLLKELAAATRAATKFKGAVSYTDWKAKVSALGSDVARELDRLQEWAAGHGTNAFSMHELDAALDASGDEDKDDDGSSSASNSSLSDEESGPDDESGSASSDESDDDFSSGGSTTGCESGSSSDSESDSESDCEPALSARDDSSSSDSESTDSFSSGTSDGELGHSSSSSLSAEDDWDTDSSSDDD